MEMNNPYILTKEEQEKLRKGNNAMWQAYCLIEFIQKTFEDDDHADLHTALSGVLNLMNNGLDLLGEV